MNRMSKTAEELVLRKIAERRACGSADVFMNKCAEALMTRNAYDWNALRNALVASELEKEASLLSAGRNAVAAGMIGLSSLFGGGGRVMQTGSGLMSHGGMPLVQEVAKAAPKAVSSVGKTVERARPTMQAAKDTANAVIRDKAAPSMAGVPSVPPPGGASPVYGKKGRGLGKILAALGIGGAAGGGAAYAATRGRGTPAPAAPVSTREHLMALLGNGRQWVRDNPGTAAGLAAGALALGGLGYSALRGNDDE